MLLAAACTADEDKPQPVAWSKVELPAEPVVLTGLGDEVLVGMRDRGAKIAPKLARIDGDRQTPIATHPKSPYAFEASWYSLAYDGSRILGLGGAPGGAHSNVRWTVWSGTTAGITEQPQSFWTFGGQNAGNLYSAVLTPAGPALLGTWGSDINAGLDGSVWLSQGTKWTRQNPAKTALRSTRALLVGPSVGTALGDGILLTGSQVRLAPNVVAQEAALWRSTRLNQGWTRIPLPDPGSRSLATAVTCPPAVDPTGGVGSGRTGTCTIAGAVDGKLAVWQYADGQAKRLRGVPELPVGDKDKLPPPVVAGDRIVQVVADGNQVKVVSGRDGTWMVQDSTGTGPTGSVAPVGPVTAAVLTRSGQLYLIAGGALWRTALGH